MNDETRFPEFMELPIGCPDCGGRLTATVGPPDPSVKPSTWTCPFCKRSHTMDFVGKLLEVVAKRG
jgi:hypothetical protein